MLPRNHGHTTVSLVVSLLCSASCNFSAQSKCLSGVMVSEQQLDEFQRVTFLSAIAMEAVVVFDDIQDKMEDHPELYTSVGVTQQELKDVHDILRKFMDGAHHRKLDLRQRILRADSRPPRPPQRFGLDEMWEAAEAAHSHLPSTTDSAPLLLPSPAQAGESEMTTEGAMT